jgi:membrane-bound lytic murein transglycosylase B
MTMGRLALVVLILLASCGRTPEPERTTRPTDTGRATTTPTPVPATTAAEPDPFALARNLEAPDARALAAALTSAEHAIRSDLEDVAAHARIQQAMYRQLVRTPEWRDLVYELVPDDLDASVRANVQAGAELRALTKPRDDLPPWRIVAPPPADRLRAAYNRAAEAFGIDWTYLAAIHLSETRMGRIRGTSVAGAQGPMQFLPQTWAAYGEGDINDPEDAIMAAARYLRAHGAPKDMPRALYAYNHSQHYVEAITLYASVMRQDARTYRAYHQWQVYYRTTKGDALLYEGWPTR